MCQSLLKEVIGDGTLTFGKGPDGGREATFTGSAPYPSISQSWTGKWIFQAKFHDIELIGVKNARSAILTDIESELDKILNDRKHECDNYIMITNVPLSGVSENGTIDRIERLLNERYRTYVPNIHVWGADDICRMLDKYANVRTAYVEFLVTGDIIQKMLGRIDLEEASRDRAVTLFLQNLFVREKHAQLDQAGDPGESRIPLEKLYIDLDVTTRNYDQLHRRFSGEDSYEFELEVESLTENGNASAIRIIENCLADRIILLGGPGQGKSTVTQFLCQLHRAAILGRLDEIQVESHLLPQAPRVPFYVQLKEFAQFVATEENSSDIETFLSNQVAARSARCFDTPDLHKVLECNPCLLILDGLDEIMDPAIRQEVMDQIQVFLDRCKSVLRCDLKVVATSRPGPFVDEISFLKLSRLYLTKLSHQKIRDYVQRWRLARNLNEERTAFLTEGIEKCIFDKQVSSLVSTPLQVTILILIVLSGGSPPQQREALFSDYLELIYKRERAKNRSILTSDKETLIGLHQYVGFLIHSKASSDANSRDVLSRSELHAATSRYLQANDTSLSDKIASERAARLITDANERLVLLVEVSQDQFGFELRSFLEFFAAAYLHDNSPNSESKFKRLKELILRDQWRNVALFFAGRVARQSRGEAPQIINVCNDIDLGGVDVYLRRGAWFASELAADRALSALPNIQRQAVEVALSLLDQHWAEPDLGRLTDQLDRLQDGDERLQIQRNIRDRIKRLNIAYLQGPMIMYSRLFGGDSLTLGVLETHLEDNQASSAEWAINLALRMNVPAAWLAPRIASAFEYTRPSVECLMGALFISPSFLAEILSDVELDDLEASELMDLSTAIFPVLSSEDQMKCELELFGEGEEISAKNQLFLAIGLHTLLERTHPRIRTRIERSLNSREMQIQLSSNLRRLFERQFGVNLTIEDLYRISNGSISGTLIQLRLASWLVLFNIEPTLERAIEFAKFLRSRELGEDRHAGISLLRLLRHAGRAVRIFAELAISSDSDENIDIVCEEFMSWISHDDDAEAQRNSTNSTENTAYAALAVDRYVMGLSQETLSSDELSTEVRLCISDGNNDGGPGKTIGRECADFGIQSLCRVDNPFTYPRVELNVLECLLNRGWEHVTLADLECLICLLERWVTHATLPDDRMEIEAFAIELCLRVCQSAAQNVAIVERCLSFVGESDVHPGRHYSFHLPGSDVRRILIEVNHYVVNETNSVMTGAARVLESIFAFEWFNLIKSDAQPELAIWPPEMVAALLAEGEETRELGLCMLPFTYLNQGSIDWIRTAFESRSATSEDELWRRFFEHVPTSPSALLSNVLVEFMTKILDENIASLPDTIFESIVQRIAFETRRSSNQMDWSQYDLAIAYREGRHST